MINDYFIIALKNLKHRGIRSWLTLLGIFIGVTAVIALISLGAGLKLAVSSQFGISSTEVLTVQAGGLNSYGPPGSGVLNPITVSDLDAIKKLSSVKTAIRRNIVSLRVDFNNIQQIKYAIQTPDGPDRAFVYENLEIEVEKGRLLTDSDTTKIMLGYNFISKTASGFDRGVEVGDKLSINGKKFEVIGITKKKGSFIFDNVIYMNEEQLEEYMPNKDNVDVIAVQAQSKETLIKTKEDIEKLLRQRRGVKIGEEDFEVQTPQAMLGTVNSILTGVQIFIVIIASISILVGAVGIVNTMTTSVLERRREIGIMKAIGAKNSQVFLQFLIEAGLLGLIGGITGAALGTLIGYLGTMGIGSFVGGKLSPNIDFMLIGLTLIGSFVVGAISGIMPARSAANQNPVEALRG
jgi:putative ABC transport system permease protein